MGFFLQDKTSVLGSISHLTTDRQFYPNRKALVRPIPWTKGCRFAEAGVEFIEL
jgi:hypothetical protein